LSSSPFRRPRSASTTVAIATLVTTVLSGVVVAACESDTASPDLEPPGNDGGVQEAAVACRAPSKPPVSHAGDIGADEVWSADSIHIVDEDVNVRNGARLTLEPCAQVQIAKGRHINVAYPGTPNTGAVVAEGKADRPIRFSGKDGARYAGFYVVGPGTVRLAHVTLENGGEGDEHGATLNIFGDATELGKGVLFVDHVTINGSKGSGIWMHRGANFIEGSAELTITSSGEEANPYPLEIDEHAMDRLPTGQYTGNRTDEISLRSIGDGSGGTGLVNDATLHDRGVPYHVGVSKHDDFIIGQPGGDKVVTLTIEPGVTMKFMPESMLRIQPFLGDEAARAVLHAVGTAERPIVFTSASPTPKAGDWVGLRFGGRPEPANKLDHVRIEYAGFDCGCILVTCSAIVNHSGAVIFTQQPPSAFITNTLFRASASNAITQGFDGVLVDFRPTNTFSEIAGCPQTLPRVVGRACDQPLPACDGL
jgi:hypothetical protein